MAKAQRQMALPLDRSVLHLLYRSSQIAGEVFAKDRADGMTFRQLVVLSAIAENEGGSQTELTDRTGIDRSTIAELVQRLIKKGLVSRRRAKRDARAYSVSTTPDGQNVRKDLSDAALKAEMSALSQMTKSDQAELLRLLQVFATRNAKPSRSLGISGEFAAKLE